MRRTRHAASRSSRKSATVVVIASLRFVAYGTAARGGDGGRGSRSAHRPAGMPGDRAARAAARDALDGCEDRVAGEQPAATVAAYLAGVLQPSQRRRHRRTVRADELADRLVGEREVDPHAVDPDPPVAV